MANVRVNNNQARILKVTLGKREGDRVARQLKLMPGMNEVDSELLAAAQAHPQFKQWGMLGWITAKGVKAAPAPVPASLPEGGGDKAPEDLSKLKAGEAIELVGKTSDLDTLERWLGVEDRATVTKALAERIESLEGTDEGGEGDDDEE
jgi:hypothetical protein